MVNRGVAPLDPTTAVGQFRVYYGDVTYTELDPVEAGYGDYAELSDAEIESFLASANSSVYRAIGNYFAILAGNAAKVSQSVKDYDLSIDDSKRPAALLEAAKMWWGRADDEDTVAGGSDIFEIFSMVTPSGSCCAPEASAQPYCGCRGGNVLF